MFPYEGSGNPVDDETHHDRLQEQENILREEGHWRTGRDTHTHTRFNNMPLVGFMICIGSKKTSYVAQIIERH